MNLPVVVIAGGMGSRLGNLTKDVPKSMVLVKQRPFIYWQLMMLKSQGFLEILLCLGHLGNVIEDYVGDGSRFGVKVSYSYDGTKPLGTGGALFNAVRELQSDFAVTYGDSYLPTNFYAAKEAFLNTEKSGLITVYKNSNSLVKSNMAKLKSGRFTYSKHSDCDDCDFVDYGMIFWRREKFMSCSLTPPWDIGDLIADMLEKDGLETFEIVDRFYEVGSLSGISDLDLFLRSSNEFC